MPALYLFPNGTTLLYYQATTCPEGWGNAAPACVGVMRGDTWRGPYHHVRSLPIVHPESEDPFVFRTRRGFHLLTNVNTYHKRCKSGVPCGGHSFSSDGLEWSAQVIGAFGPVLTLANGTVVHNSYVERPQVSHEPPSSPCSHASWEHHATNELSCASCSLLPRFNSSPAPLPA